ncbi:hypothetical protein B0H17DRAFT_1135699 [Mycena rosella]|uniref:Uncharacterized protein n=1 Tax=Mycena rosella TaxID=1033263 RepID=A0AAD7DC72_MYCRO|nr:hypothetical protein B0H17DRAFT_1135699 [Mycena rosella]
MYEETRHQETPGHPPLARTVYLSRCPRHLPKHRPAVGDASAAVDAASMLPDHINRHHVPRVPRDPSSAHVTPGWRCCRHDSDDEEEVQSNAEYLPRQADEFIRAAEILRAHVPHKNRIWMSSIVKRDIGHNVSLMVADINRHEHRAQKRDNTWPKNGDKEGARHSQNTMGYQCVQTEEVTITEVVEEGGAQAKKSGAELD